jgi:hypothetical protein
MANLDDMIRNAVPGGNLAKPLLIALLGLLGSGALFKSGGAQSPAATTPHPRRDDAASSRRRRRRWSTRRTGRAARSISAEWPRKCHQFMDRERAKSAGTTWSTRVDSGTEYHKVACSELRLVRGGAHQAVVADPSRSCRQTDAARPNSVPRRTQ